MGGGGGGGGKLGPLGVVRDWGSCCKCQAVFVGHSGHWLSGTVGGGHGGRASLCNRWSAGVP